MTIRNLASNCAWTQLSVGVGAGVDGAFVDLAEIDMQGYESCAIVFLVGTIAASGVITVRVKNSATAGTYGAGTIDRIGSDVANNADTDDNKFIIVDVHRPQRRYLRASYQRTTGNVTIAAAFAIRYNGGGPITSADVEQLVTLNGPTPSAS